MQSISHLPSNVYKVKIFVQNINLKLSYFIKQPILKTKKIFPSLCDDYLITLGTFIEINNNDEKEKTILSKHT